jgi:hypothetical protein
MAFFLAAIIARLLSRILGTLDASFGAIVANRGEAGADAGGSTGGGGSLVDTTGAVASASATPRRFVSSVKDRVGIPQRAQRRLQHYHEDMNPLLSRLRGLNGARDDPLRGGRRRRPNHAIERTSSRRSDVAALAPMGFVLAIQNSRRCMTWRAYVFG